MGIHAAVFFMVLGANITIAKIVGLFSELGRRHCRRVLGHVSCATLEGK